MTGAGRVFSFFSNCKDIGSCAPCGIGIRLYVRHKLLVIQRVLHRDKEMAHSVESPAVDVVSLITLSPIH